MALKFFQNSSSLEDDELMEKIAEGCSKSFSVLFERHGSRVLGYAKKILGDAERAEDVSQEIWMKVVKQAPSYSKEGYFKAWVMTMTRNQCLNIIRKDQRITFKEDVSELMDREFESDFEKKILESSDIEELKKALDELPENQRLALTILISEDVSYEDLAKQLDLSLSALKSLIHRARKSLQKKLQREVA